jgi:hypothetical protein
MVRWRQSTRGNESPAVGGDYIRDSYNAHHTHLTPGWTEIIGDNYKLRNEIQALEHSAYVARGQAAKYERSRNIWRGLATALSVVGLVLAIVVVKSTGGDEGTNQASPSGADSLAASTSPESASLPLASEPTPTPTPTDPAALGLTVGTLPCGRGRWIAVFDGFKVGVDPFSKVVAAVKLLRQRSPDLEIKYAVTPPTCGTAMDPGFGLLYAGPFASPRDVVSLCNRLGWFKNTNDHFNHCHGRALDESRQRTVRPDGVLLPPLK